jgi:hypothetical protein
MAQRSGLAVYLNDHLAGATAACDLIERAQGECRGTPLEDFFGNLLGDVQQDRQTLERIMDRLGIEQDQLKQATARLAELFSRFKLTGHNEHAGRLLMLETLSLGIEGKACLWKSLDETFGDADTLSDFDFGDLLDRAEAQRADIEEQRLAIAPQALELPVGTNV